MNATTPRSAGRVPTAVSPPLQHRRGVLLLVVLSLLTLFMMLGTTYMVVTARAKATARAFARAATAQQSAREGAGRQLVDDAFRILARGTTNVNCKEKSLVRGDDLLGDRYGRTLPGINIRGQYARIAANGVSDLVGGPNGGQATGLISLSLEAPLKLSPASVSGRIATLTFPGMCRSRRILRATGPSIAATDQLVIAAVSPIDGSEITAAQINRGIAATAADPAVIHLVINGRELVGDLANAPTLNAPPYGDTHEAYDGFGDVPNRAGTMTDPYLASLVGTDASDQPFDTYAATPDTSIQPNVRVQKMSFFGVENDPQNPANAPEIDNDADGVLDSKWIDVGFPVMRAEDGTPFRAQAAYLVLDLDSRLSLNAHGDRFQLDALVTAAEPTNPLLDWPLENSTLPPPLTDQQFSELPFGSGYGPAEVRLWDLFSERPGFLPDSGGADIAGVNHLWQRGVDGFYGSANPFVPNTADTNQKRPTLGLTNLAGRYGYGPQVGNQPHTEGPGQPYFDDSLSAINDAGWHPQQAAVTNSFYPNTITDFWRTGVTPAQLEAGPDRYNSPSDLSGRMKVIADSQAPGDGLVSKLWYAKPAGLWEGDTTDDPYEVRLARPSAYDNIFLPDELERMLRIYDWDASQLPVRLAGLLGPDAERLRFLLTTDSWDTTAIVGDTWRQIETVLTDTNAGFDPAVLGDLLAPETLTGRRLDLNRQTALSDGSAPARAERFCRNLYVLMWALIKDPTSPTPPTPEACQAIAQWAVNVLDFRDPDSTMTSFYYDEDPRDGWNLSPNLVVTGTERPEILITEALCWKEGASTNGGVHIVLHRPWSAKALDGDSVLPYDGNGDPIDTPDIRDPDAIAPELAARDPQGALMNELDLGRLGGNDPDSPVWRLKIGTNAQSRVIRFDLVDPNAITIDPAAPQYSSDDPDPQARFVPPDGWICITGDSDDDPAGGAPQIEVGLPRLVINQTDGLSGGPVPSAAASGMQVLVLERLANPLLRHQPDASQGNYNPYVEVDRIFDVPVADREEVAPSSDIPRQYYAARKRSLTGTTTSVFWRQRFEGDALETISSAAQYDASKEDEVEKLTRPAGGRVAWFPWLNRPFTSPVELALVPTSSPDMLLEDYDGFMANGWLDKLATAVGLQSDILVSDLFQSTIVPSRFADLATSVADPNVFANTGTGLDLLAINQISSWREPGRVNLNTVSDDRVWDATVRRVPRPATVTSKPSDNLDRSDAGFGIPAAIGGTAAAPAEDLLDLYGLDAGGGTIFADPLTTPGQEYADNPQFCCLTSNRLANVATNRSNVFAIWVTIGFFECDAAGNFVMTTDVNGNATPREMGSDTGEISRHRGFYVFDRSIPVGYVTGRDLNLDDAIRLRRIIQ